MSHSRSSIGSLTGVRGFAALWVVLNHLRDVTAEAYPDLQILQHIAGQGYLGVDLFAFLSGYIMAYTYGDRMETFSWQNYRRFAWLRFVRTYPLHIFVMALFAIEFVYDRGWNAAPILLYDDAFLRQLFLLNGLGFEDKWEWNVPSWTLSSEWACYLVFPFLIPYIQPIKNGFLLVALAVVIMGITIVVMRYTGHPRFDAALDWGVARIAGEFFIGCLLYRFQLTPIVKKLPMGWIGVLTIPLLVYSLTLPRWTPLTVCGFALLVLALAEEKQPLRLIFGNRVSVFLGEISFSIYMLHWIILSNHQSLQLGRFGPEWRLYLTLALVIALSTLSYFLVEKTARNRLRNFAVGDPEWETKKVAANQA